MFKSPTTRDLVEQVELHFPSLRIFRARRIVGVYNTVLEANNRYVFRFPTSRSSEKHLMRETVLLPLLRKRLTVSVPNYEFVWPGARQSRGLFAGYRMILGDQLSRKKFELGWTRWFATSMGRFLRELHSVDVDRKPLRAILGERSLRERKRQLVETYRDVRQQVYRFLDKETRALSDRFWADLIKEIMSFQFDPVLIHGDLIPRNILVNPRNGKLNGIIDWGDAGISDPAIDFFGLFDLDNQLGHEAVRVYGEISYEFLARVEWYWKLSQFYDVLDDVAANSMGRLRSANTRIRHRLRSRIPAVSMDGDR